MTMVKIGLCFWGFFNDMFNVPLTGVTLALGGDFGPNEKKTSRYKYLPGMTGPPNSFTARGPVTLTSILFTQPAV